MTESFSDESVQRRNPDAVMYGLIGFLAVCSYANSFPGGFFWDDVWIVRDNPLVATLDLYQIFTLDYWRIENSGLFRPLTILSFALNRMIAGGSAWSFHLGNVLLHAVVALLACRYLRRLGVQAIWATLVAAIFAAHPLHTETINQIVGRSELLAMFFALIALDATVLPGPVTWRTPRLYFACGACLAAVLSKEHVVVLVAMIPWVDLVSARRNDVQWQWRERWSLYLGTGVVIAAWLAYAKFGVDRAGLYVRPPDMAYTPHALLPAFERVLLALKVQLLYAAKLLIPFNLQGVYSPAPLLQTLSLSSPLIWASVAAWLALFGVITWGWRRLPLLSVALGLYLLSGLVTSNLFFATGVVMAERLTYFPSLWFALALVVVSASVCQTVRWKRLGLALGCAYVIALGVVTLLRNSDYASPTCLWQTDVRRNPLNDLAWINYAAAVRDTLGYSQGEEIYRQALQYFPQHPHLLINYAALLLELNRSAEAVELARRGVQADSDLRDFGLLCLAKGLIRQGLHEEGLATLAKISDSRLAMQVWETKGIALESLGDLAGAIAAYREVGLPPRETIAYQRLAKLLLELGRYGEAESVLQMELSQDPSASGYNDLGNLLLTRSQLSEAESAFAKAVELAPNTTVYRDNLSRVRRQLHKSDNH